MDEYSIALTGIGMGESARWHDERFWYADWLAGTISVLEPDGRPRVVATVPSFPISFDWLPDGRMLVVSGREGFLSTVENGELQPYCDLRTLSPFPWNELAVDGAGNAYVNGIGYEFPGPAQVSGVIARVDPGGEAVLLASDLAFPNGMALTANGATLIVGESHAGCLTAFDIVPDGTLGNRRTWAAVANSAPDGICWGSDDTIWYADVPNRECVRVAEGGRIVERAAFGAACFACATSTDVLYAMTADWPLNFDPRAARSGEVRTLPLQYA